MRKKEWKHKGQGCSSWLPFACATASSCTNQKQSLAGSLHANTSLPTDEQLAHAFWPNMSDADSCAAKAHNLPLHRICILKLFKTLPFPEYMNFPNLIVIVEHLFRPCRHRWKRKETLDLDLRSLPLLKIMVKVNPFFCSRIRQGQKSQK